MHMYMYMYVYMHNTQDRIDATYTHMCTYMLYT